MKHLFLFSNKPLFLLLAVCFVTAACSSVETDPSYKDKYHEDRYEYGSLLSDEGGIKLFGTDENAKKAKNTGLGVNGYLWRASLDTLAFLPIASADPFGGVITTDWHSTEVNKNERIRLNVLILDRDLRADGVKVTIFRQTREEGKDWENAPVAPATASSLEETILSRARQMRLAQIKKED